MDKYSNIIDKGIIKLTNAGFLYDYDTSVDNEDIVIEGSWWKFTPQ